MAKNITIAIPEELARRARDVARRQGASLNSLIRVYLEGLAGERTGEDVADELLELMERHGGRSGGRRVRREEAYESRT